MALNENLRDADHLSLPVPQGTKSGDPIRVGCMNGVCQTDRNEGGAPDPVTGPAVNTNPVGNATVWLKGSHVFEVAFAIANVGTPVYITAGGDLTATATGNFFYGAALSTKSATAGPLEVAICKFWPTAAA